MSTANNVAAEINALGEPIRIFRGQRTACVSGKPWIWLDRRIAVGMIRHALFVRSKNLCEFCAARLTEKSGHMHEMKHRGQGGEISLENSVFICHRCHKTEHADRNPKWSKSNGTNKN